MLILQMDFPDEKPPNVWWKRVVFTGFSSVEAGYKAL